MKLNLNQSEIKSLIIVQKVHAVSHRQVSWVSSVNHHHTVHMWSEELCRSLQAHTGVVCQLLTFRTSNPAFVAAWIKVFTVQAFCVIILSFRCDWLDFLFLDCFPFPFPFRGFCDFFLVLAIQETFLIWGGGQNSWCPSALCGTFCSSTLWQRH